MVDISILLGSLQHLVKVDEKIKKTPGYRQLLKMGSPVLLKEKIDDATDVTVFENGYVLYSKKEDGVERNAVFSILNPKLCYEFPAKNSNPIYINDYPEFLNWSALDIIKLCGDDQLELNRYSRNQKKESKILDAEGNYHAAATQTSIKLHHDYDYDLAQYCIDRDSRAQREKREEKQLSLLWDAISKLTAIQQDVIRETFFAELSCAELARRTGKNPKTVSECKKQALKRLNKIIRNMEKNM